MHLNIHNPSESAKILLICALSILLLFFGFLKNYWQVADGQWFANHQRDMESFIVARMVMSRQDGVLSHGGLTGLGSQDANPVHYFDHPFSDV